MKELKTNITETCDYLVNNFEREFIMPGRSQQISDNILGAKSNDLLFDSEDESSFGDSSLNQVCSC